MRWIATMKEVLRLSITVFKLCDRPEVESGACPIMPSYFFTIRRIKWGGSPDPHESGWRANMSEAFDKPRLAINRVYTRAGDTGLTSLAGGQRLPKNHPRIEAVRDRRRTERLHRSGPRIGAGTY